MGEFLESCAHHQLSYQDSLFDDPVVINGLRAEGYRLLDVRQSLLDIIYFADSARMRWYIGREPTLVARFKNDSSSHTAYSDAITGSCIRLTMTVALKY